MDTEKDQEALRQAQFDRKLKAQKLTELTKKGVTTATVNDIKVEPNEYARYLTLAYKKETFPGSHAMCWEWPRTWKCPKWKN